MIRYKREYDNILPLNRIFIGNQSIAMVCYNGRVLWPISDGDSILSCYCNGYWDDRYQWTDNTPWSDK